MLKPTVKHVNYIRIPQSEDNIFVNRESELNLLYDAYKTASSQFTKRFITGFPGVGKTTLLTQFLGKLEDDGEPFLCVWIKGHRIEKLELESENFVLRFFKCKQPDEDKPHTELSWAAFFKPFVEKFRECDEVPTNGTIILVVSNVVKETYGYVKALSDQLIKLDHILLLITSGISPEFGEKHEDIKLQELKRTFSKDLLTRGKLGECSEKDLEHLSQECSDFPIALQQAISYIRKLQKDGSEYYIRNYVQDINVPGKLEELVRHELRWGHKRTNSIVKSVKLTVNKLKSEDKYGKLAIAMLQILAWLDDFSIEKSEFIDITGLEQLYSVESKPDCDKRQEHKLSIGLLKDYKLIRQSEETINLANHNIMHKATRCAFWDNKTTIVRVLVINYCTLHMYLKSVAFVKEVESSLSQLVRNIKDLEKTKQMHDICLHDATMIYVKYLHICKPVRAVQVLQDTMEKYQDMNSAAFASRRIEILIHLGTLYKDMKRFGEEIILREKLNQYLEDDQDQDIYLSNLLQLSLAYLKLGHLTKARNYWTSIAHNDESNNKEVKLEAAKLLKSNGLSID